MKSFRDKFLDISEEELLVKRRLWEREQEERKKLIESLKTSELGKKIRKFLDEGDDDFGGYFDFPGWDQGVVSDPPIAGARLEFYRADGSIAFGETDENGRFRLPPLFYSGYIIAKGGIDTVSGLEFKGEMRMDLRFFMYYPAITPFNHVINHIWENTPTLHPEEAVDLAIQHMNDLVDFDLCNIKQELLTDDPIKLTLLEKDGSKELQAANTLIEILSDIIGNTNANHEEEVSKCKSEVYSHISHQLLKKINGEEIGNLIDISQYNLKDNHLECCETLIEKAKNNLMKCIYEDCETTTKDMQSVNLAVKTEWSEKAFNMTSDPNCSIKDLWRSIKSKKKDSLKDQINLEKISI